MFKTARLIFLAIVMGASGVVGASPCTGNDWQPTFVHDLERPDGPWYVTAGGGFLKLPGNTVASWTPAACRLIATQGLRDRRGFTNCQAYTRVQCGCTRADLSNATCAAFIAMRP